jgi:hypothetical protein
LAALVALLLAIAPELVVLVVVAGFVVCALVVVRHRRGIATEPARRAGAVLNPLAVAFLATSLVSAGWSGALTSPRDGVQPPRGIAPPGSPDVYLLMLDGYPRADTLQTSFAFDNAPFLDAMRAEGFQAAPESHANYPMTLLTLASLLNGRLVGYIVPASPAALPEQYRLLSRLINQGSELEAFRSAGYEIVSIPSEFEEAAIGSADRVLDSGEMTTFELALVLNGLPKFLPGSDRIALTQHRSRLLATFATLRTLAEERTGVPKLVVGHVLSPHAPIAFGRHGEVPPPLPCPVTSCSPYTFGDEYGDRWVGPMLDQIGWLNDTVLDTVRAIRSRSAQPPVIVVFSDHGMRNDPADRDEMFRSLFLAATPGHPQLFPSNVTPVNILGRLRNSYTGSNAPLAPETSWWVDARNPASTGLFPTQIQPIP